MFIIHFYLVAWFRLAPMLDYLIHISRCLVVGKSYAITGLGRWKLNHLTNLIAQLYKLESQLGE